jgi:hypothetical protein
MDIVYLATLNSVSMPAGRAIRAMAGDEGLKGSKGWSSRRGQAARSRWDTVPILVLAWEVVRDAQGLEHGAAMRAHSFGFGNESPG